MTLNASGPISLAGTTIGQSIELELGGNGTTQISLNDTNVRSLAAVSSGTIVMPTNFWGKTNTVWYTESGLATALGSGYNSNSVAYGSSLFFATNSTGYGASSPDGITWTNQSGIRSIFSGGSLNGVVSNGSIFVGYGQNSSSNALIASSSNGSTWTSGYTGSAGGPQFGAWNGTKFCLVANLSATTWTSTNGTSWTANSSNLPTSGFATYAIASNGSIFCLIGASFTGGALAYTSTDGVTWTAQTGLRSAFSGANNANTITWNGSIFCVTGTASSGPGVCATSPDGFSWTAQTGFSSLGSGNVYSPYASASLGTLICVIGLNSSNNACAVLSGNGSSWQASTSFTSAFGSLSVPAGLAASSTIFCAVGSQGSSPYSAVCAIT